MAYIQSIRETGVIDVYFFVPITGKKVTLVKVQSLSSLLCQNLNNKKKTYQEISSVANHHDGFNVSIRMRA